jgi:outer membrane protein assembly factor BamE (lipoprotein component of BamABCDE complex)
MKRTHAFARLLVLAVTGIGLLFLNLTSSADDFKRPTKGMSKTQVRAIYGDPDDVIYTDAGETWTYTSGTGRAFIPFYGAFTRPSVLVLIFNARGRLRSYSFNQGR